MTVYSLSPTVYSLSRGFYSLSPTVYSLSRGFYSLSPMVYSLFRRGYSLSPMVYSLFRRGIRSLRWFIRSFGEVFALSDGLFTLSERLFALSDGLFALSEKYSLSPIGYSLFRRGIRSFNNLCLLLGFIIPMIGFFGLFYSIKAKQKHECHFFRHSCSYFNSIS